MVRRKFRFDADAIIKISQLFLALAAVFAPILWIWNRFEILEFVNLDFVVRMLLSGIYVIILYLVYNQLFTRYMDGEE